MRSVIAALLFLAVTANADAQNRCLVTDSPRECFNRWAPVLGGPTPPVQQSSWVMAEDSVRALIATANGGTSDLTAPSRTALKDFFSILSNELQSGVVGDDGTNLSFGYNVPFPLLGERHQLRLESVFGKPRISDAAKTAIGDTTQIESSLTALDDLALSVAFNPGTVRFGRGLEPHRALFASLFTAPIFATEIDAQNAFAQSLVSAGISGPSLDTAFHRINVDPVAQLVLVKTFEDAARAALPAPATAATDQFALLLGNQPQLWASATYWKRDVVVGPPAWSGRLTWEIGSQNLNNFYRNEGRGCARHALDAAEGARCADALIAFLARTTTAHQADRLALSVEYLFSEGAKVAAATPYEYAEERRLLYSVTYGRTFGSPLTGRDSRIDFTYTYSDGKGSTSVTTGPMLLAAESPEPSSNVIAPPYARSTAAFTFAPRITDRITALVSVVYADRVEELPFRPRIISPPLPPSTTESSERDLSVRAGIVFKLGPSGPSSANRCCCK